MSGRSFIVDPSELDFGNVIADTEAIRRLNPQRFEMEQLTAIVYEDAERGICVGYKEITLDEFWVRGHMPGTPIMPGVLMCEAAAQLCSYFSTRYDFLGADVVGFGGMESVRFREPVFPPCRFIVSCQRIKVRRGAIIVSLFQGIVDDTIVVDGTLKGIPLRLDTLGVRESTNS